MTPQGWWNIVFDKQQYYQLQLSQPQPAVPNRPLQVLADLFFGACVCVCVCGKRNATQANTLSRLWVYFLPRGPLADVMYM